MSPTGRGVTVSPPPSYFSAPQPRRRTVFTRRTRCGISWMIPDAAVPSRTPIVKREVDGTSEIGGDPISTRSKREWNGKKHGRAPYVPRCVSPLHLLPPLFFFTFMGFLGLDEPPFAVGTSFRPENWGTVGYDSFHDGSGKSRIRPLEKRTGSNRSGTFGATPETHRAVATRVGRRKIGQHVRREGDGGDLFFEGGWGGICDIFAVTRSFFILFLGSRRVPRRFPVRKRAAGKKTNVLLPNLPLSGNFSLRIAPSGGKRVGDAVRPPAPSPTGRRGHLAARI